MATPRMRPEFSRSLAADPTTFFAELAVHLQQADAAVRGQTFDGGAILRLCDSDRHVWSPALYLHVDRDPVGPWQLHGRFSPSSPVWTAYVAIYLTLACLAIAAGCYGGAQIILGETPWAFWGIPAVVVLALLTYGAALIGQGLSADDMYRLRAFVDGVVDALGSG